MNKKIIVFLIGMSLLACNFLFPQAKRSAPRPSDFQDPQPTGFTIVRLHPEDGKLQTLLASEAQKAAALGRQLFVEFDATWCPPCQAIDQAIKADNELILNAYAETYIIRLDVDEWGWGDSRLHDFQFDGIPVFFKLDADGQQTGEVIDGGAWGEDIPENIAPVMQEFFHSQ
ncbi:MAG TPA: thioredoxin family protein [Anaerolineales bacterium]|nr:thioredoxin family protein [Anaerolineales bacterium]